MQVTIIGRHFHPDEQTRIYAEQKAEKLSRFFDGIQSVKVTLAGEGDRQRAEMVVQTSHKGTLVAQQSGVGMLVAIDLVTGKMERQLKRFKDKLKDRRENRRL